MQQRLLCYAKNANLICRDDRSHGSLTISILIGRSKLPLNKSSNQIAEEDPNTYNANDYTFIYLFRRKSRRQLVSQVKSFCWIHALVLANRQLIKGFPIFESGNNKTYIDYIIYKTCSCRHLNDGKVVFDNPLG